MILVDVYVPSVDETWDFLLDENTDVSKIILELVGMISKKMKNEEPLDPMRFHLYDLSGKEDLPVYEKLGSCGIRDGSRLMLV